jgi:hypothetical protein
VHDEQRLLYENEKDIVDGCIGGPDLEKFMLTKPQYPDLFPPEGEYAYPYPQRYVTEAPDPTPVRPYVNKYLG